MLQHLASPNTLSDFKGAEGDDQDGTLRSLQCPPTGTETASVSSVGALASAS